MPRAVYKNTLDDSNVTFDFPVEFARFYEDEPNSLPYAQTEEGISFNLGDDGHAICNVYGMEEVALSRMDLREGETIPIPSMSRWNRDRASSWGCK